MRLIYTVFVFFISIILIFSLLCVYVFKCVYCFHAFISYVTRAIDMHFNKWPLIYLLFTYFLQYVLQYITCSVSYCVLH